MSSFAQEDLYDINDTNFHIQQLQVHENIPKYRIILGEKAPPGQDPQLFLLPTATRELCAAIIVSIA